MTLHIEHRQVPVPSGANVSQVQWHLSNEAFDELMIGLDLPAKDVKKLSAEGEDGPYWFRSIRFQRDGLVVAMFSPITSTGEERRKTVVVSVEE